MTLPWVQRVTATMPLTTCSLPSATASTCNSPRPGPSGPTVSVLQDTLPGPRCLNASSRPATPFFLLTSRLSCRNFFSLQDGVTFWCGRYCGMGLRSGVDAGKSWAGPRATGMSHTSLQGRIHGVSRPAQPPTGHAPDVEHRRQPDFTVLVRSPSANTHPAHHDPTPDAAPACDTTNAGTRHCHASPPPY